MRNTIVTLMAPDVCRVTGGVNDISYNMRVLWVYARCFLPQIVEQTARHVALAAIGKVPGLHCSTFLVKEILNTPEKTTIMGAFIRLVFPRIK